MRGLIADRDFDNWDPSTVAQTRLMTSVSQIGRGKGARTEPKSQRSKNKNERVCVGVFEGQGRGVVTLGDYKDLTLLEHTDLKGAGSETNEEGGMVAMFRGVRKRRGLCKDTMKWTKSDQKK